jgi:hypothetical protein
MYKPVFGISRQWVLRRFLLVSFLLSLRATATMYAQVDSVELLHEQFTPSRPDTSADIWDVYYRFINRKGHRSAEREQPGFHPSIFPELAYALQTGFAVGLNANLAFTSADPKQNISIITTTPQYTQYRQIIIPVVTNLWTKGNRYNILSDWRYYDYSADNFGLGGFAPAEADDRLMYSYLRLHQSVMRQLVPNFSVGIGYALDYHWRIRDENNTPQVNDDFHNYNATERTVSSGLMFSVQYTTRRNPNNPEGSFFGNVMVRPNMRFLGSDQNWQAVVADFRKYVSFPGNSRNILAFWSMNWLSFGGQAPYLDLPSTGWDTYSNLGRGYTQGRFRGRNLVYLETEYRFPLLTNGLVGGVVFANMQAYSDWPSNAFDRILPGGGAGLRVKVNKHSNLNFSFDYGFGIGGSQGLFLNLGEVF